MLLCSFEVRLIIQAGARYTQCDARMLATAA